MQHKAKQRIKHIKMLQQVFTHMYPPGFFFLPPIGRWLLYRQTHKHKGFAVYNDKQPQVQNLKWRHLFRGVGGFFSQHILYTVLNFFCFSITFLDNVSIPIVLEHYVWMEPLLVSLFREHFKLIFFSPQRQSSKGSIPLCEADEASRDLGKEGVGRSSCPQLLGRSPFP